ncbi:3-deoxy-manno-octulosonate cytidylyltransferase [Helicobacter sp. 16-1353]|uniref:3-deoxy-manno-octulosonate cytidylyltransferase n=1 Tax=Helicobacter sp. 16-1353 TaxID=2004996 RepID=UPI000DCCFC4A|nr:manno-octulosonate cytidylyltransferase [Helicobacter sp. 16-1353]RAX52074.1 3-deoxy-manno-octulosonate cytidylyltransferase [Helicobacter sp. 16-1353]
MIIIPARLQSTRLPNKLLLPLDGVPIIVRVANIAKELDSCVVACDDEAILEVCKKHKIECVMTAKTHTSGTDRCAEAVSNLGLGENEVVINLQGDEPFIEPGVIEKLKNAMQNAINWGDSALDFVLDSANLALDSTDSASNSTDSSDSIFMASCYKTISDTEADDPNLVKVVVNSRNLALYFSRSKIPYNRENIAMEHLGHLGIYAFSAKSLREFCGLSKSPLEEIEKLEQLRTLWHNKKILMVKVESKSIGIDTLEDYEKAKEILT